MYLKVVETNWEHAILGDRERKASKRRAGPSSNPPDAAHMSGPTDVSAQLRAATEFPDETTVVFLHTGEKWLFVLNTGQCI
jgi:hypothetical protein